jgi:hypothetical protein
MILLYSLNFSISQLGTTKGIFETVSDTPWKNKHRKRRLVKIVGGMVPEG